MKDFKCVACGGTGLASDVNAERQFARDEEMRREGAFDERLRVVTFIADNQDTLKAFAGDRTAEMLVFMFREMTPEAVSA